MTETISGAAHLARIEFLNHFIPLRTAKKIKELREAIKAEGELKKDEQKVFVDEKRRNFPAFVEDQEHAVRHVMNATNSLFGLGEDIAYDMDEIKKRLVHILSEDVTKELQLNHPKSLQKVEKELRTAQIHVNEKLRNLSDTLGKLTTVDNR